jgi:Uma2 family endonuclease
MGVPEAHDYLLTPEEYLAGEEAAETKHEYVGGVVYAMSGATNRHNILSMNALGLLFAQLRGTGCRPFNSDTKVRIRFPDHTRFYYPDAMVVCHQNALTEVFQDSPLVIIEVISPSTRRTDQEEKRAAYLTVQTLCAYIVLEQHQPTATVWRRNSGGFKVERYATLDAVIRLPEISATVALAEVYDGVDFTAAEPTEE